MKTIYRVKIGFAIHYETDIDIEAENAIQAMNAATDGYTQTLLTPSSKSTVIAQQTSPAIISVSKKT